jgi:hypothetical protein
MMTNVTYFANGTTTQWLHDFGPFNSTNQTKIIITAVSPYSSVNATVLTQNVTALFVNPIFNMTMNVTWQPAEMAYAMLTTDTNLITLVPPAGFGQADIDPSVNRESTPSTTQTHIIFDALQFA